MQIPAQDRLRTHLRSAKPLRSGLEGVLHRLVGVRRRRSSFVAEWGRAADAVLHLVEELRPLSENQLRQRLLALRAARRQRHDDAPEAVQAAFAALAVAAERTVGLSPYREQIMGAIGLTRGFLVEMATGEGKTLTLGLAASYLAWDGRPCHIVTANDYLAERDALNLRPLYAASGCSAGFVIGSQEEPDRRRHYHCSVTYTTSKELVADFLRDRLRYADLADASRRQLRHFLNPALRASPPGVQRGLYTVLVDEADYILIDEAVTPLIISRPRHNSMVQEAVRASAALVETLQEGRDYRLDPQFQEVEWQDETLRRLEQEDPSRLPILRNPVWRTELAEQALRARHFYLHGKNYLVQDGKVVIVDEGTGRLMPMRSWRLGVHQAVEHKEGLAMTDPAETMASLSFQRFFRLVPKLAGVTGTARENAHELWSIYELPVVALPTHRPCLRLYNPCRVTIDADAKWVLAIAEIKRVHATGRPILVGTRSISASEHLALLLRDEGLPFQLLNAANHRAEADIVANAGHAQSITIATNMAGRGTDIRLESGLASLGGLHVIATEKHEARRIDRQLYGRCARQGDPGSVQQFASLQDELAVRFLPGWLRRLVIYAVRHSWPLADHGARLAIHSAQRAAMRHSFRSRLGLLRQDRWASESLSFGAGPRGL